jgi:Zn-dependent peptidase ImmA (M78 family)/DNA-binding XRE family transcriptional regulator
MSIVFRLFLYISTKFNYNCKQEGYKEVIMIGERLKRARDAANLSLRALAEKVGVSQTTISKYEKEQATPDSTMLLKLARAVGVKSEYFFRTDEFVLENKEYRKRAISNIQLKAIEAKILDEVERRFELESLFPKPPSKKFEVPDGLPQKINFLYEIDDFADRLREMWNIGLDPISDLSDLLEEHGIRVFMISESADNQFDGLAATVNGHQIIVVSRDWSGDRQRFTLSHELGHLMLEGRLAQNLDEEKASDRFAGAFLLPTKAVKKALGESRKSLEIAELGLIKEEYGISMQGAFIRANQAKIISYEYSSSLWKLFKKEGWDKKEPSKPYPSEDVHQFKRLVLKALALEYIGESKAAELLGMSIKKFHIYRMTGK